MLILHARRVIRSTPAKASLISGVVRYDLLYVWLWAESQVPYGRKSDEVCFLLGKKWPA